MAKKRTIKKDLLSLDDRDFVISRLGDSAKVRADKIVFINDQILQKTNELQIADSARLMYLSVLKKELKKINP